MTSRTLLSIVLGVACSALAVGGLYWAGGRDATADPSLDQSADARAAYEAGQVPAGEPRLRPPSPATTSAVEVVEAAGGAPTPAPEPTYDDEDHDASYGAADDDDHREDRGDREEHDDEGEDD